MLKYSGTFTDTYIPNHDKKERLNCISFVMYSIQRILLFAWYANWDSKAREIHRPHVSPNYAAYLENWHDLPSGVSLHALLTVSYDLSPEVRKRQTGNRTISDHLPVLTRSSPHHCLRVRCLWLCTRAWRFLADLLYRKRPGLRAVPSLRWTSRLR